MTAHRMVVDWWEVGDSVALVDWVVLRFGRNCCAVVAARVVGLVEDDRMVCLTIAGCGVLGNRRLLTGFGMSWGVLGRSRSRSGRYWSSQSFGSVRHDASG